MPAAITLGGMSLATTAPAPITLFSPIVTPLHTIALSPIQTLSCNVIGAQLPGALVRSYTSCQSASVR